MPEIERGGGKPMPRERDAMFEIAGVRATWMRAAREPRPGAP
jgi:hypothetical protein